LSSRVTPDVKVPGVLIMTSGFEPETM
jgi:hypothetical protein